MRILIVALLAISASSFVPVYAAGQAIEGGFYAEKLAEFWAVKRFSYDHHRHVKLKPVMESALLTKAEADECFAGVGQPYPPLSPDKQCTSGGIEKRNQGYVWGTVKVGSDIWFGTVANMPCMVLAGTGLDVPLVNGSFVCEGSAAQSGTRDFRAPKIFKYNLKTKETEEKLLVGGPAMLLATTQGIRSAGSADGIVFLAGPSVASGLNFFAFDAETGQLISATNLPGYNDIRSWVNVRGALYTAVGAASVQNGQDPGGYVLRWVGKRSSIPEELFNFETVGNLDADGASIVEHRGRLYVSTWPTLFSSWGSDLTLGERVFGIYESPRIPRHGLHAKHATCWQKVWSIKDYEPDSLAASITGGGALASFGGYLYWSTMNLPFAGTGLAVLLHQAKKLDLDQNQNGALDVEELLATALGTHRSATIFRGMSGKHRNDAQVVYGEKYLPIYEPTLRTYTVASDSMHRNLMHQVPKWGASGLGNFFNAYIWTMEVYQDQLFVGTFDWSGPLRAGALGLIGSPNLPPVPVIELDRLRERFGATIPMEGADLYRFRRGAPGAVAESLSGVGNDTNYGIRTMLQDGHHLILGTANPMNVHPRGGWELLLNAIR